MSAPGQETPAEGAPTTDTPAAPSVDYSPVLDRMGELAGTIDTRFAALEQRLPAAPEPPAAPDPWDDLQQFFAPQDQGQVDAYGNPIQAQPQAPQFDPQALQTAMQAAIQQSNAPLVAQLQQFQLERDTQQLYKDIPQLAPVAPTDPGFAANQALRQQTHQLVQQSLAGYPPEIQSALSANAKYISTVFKAAEAEKLAQGQAPAGGQVPSLEAAGGALPGGSSEPVNPADAAYAGRQGLPAAWG